MNDTASDKKTKVVNEYRCTRSDLYKHDCFGREDLSARDGHYIVSFTAEAALEEMKRRYPAEKNFTVDLWKEAVYIYTTMTVE